MRKPSLFEYLVLGYVFCVWMTIHDMLLYSPELMVQNVFANRELISQCLMIGLATECYLIGEFVVRGAINLAILAAVLFVIWLLINIIWNIWRMINGRNSAEDEET